MHGRINNCRLAIVVSIFAVSALYGSSAPGVSKVVSLTPPPRAGEPVGRWDGDAFLTIENHSSASPMIHIQDDSGREVQQIMVSVPDADLITVLNNDFARSADGYVAITGSAFGNNRGAGFLMIVAPGGGQTLVRTEPYVASAVAFANDGNIWTAGLENDANGRDKPANASYFMIRRFDRNGRQLGGSLPRNTFAMRVTPVFNSVLVSSPDRVGWFSRLAHRYMEFSLDGEQIADYALDVPRLGIEGVALCQDNTFWVSVGGPGRSDLKSLNRVTGAMVLRLSKEPFLNLYGCSGKALITSSSAAELNWLSAE